MVAFTAQRRENSTTGRDRTYLALEERILERDQVGAAKQFFELVKERRPLPEMLREIVSIHAPYTHVPYHQRIDAGVPRFVNNDHCLLSARASTRLMEMMPASLRHLPLTQTVWYIPTGLDAWNQLLGEAPGHYNRNYHAEPGKKPMSPQVHWPDAEPLYEEGSFDERLNGWLTLVQRGEVVNSYRVFVGLLDSSSSDEAARTRLLAQMVFAGLIDVQDRMYLNKSYTTGHKSHRARATVELGNLVGWDTAHSIVYAGVPDIAVGPRWYSLYEMSCNIAQTSLDGRDAEMTRHDRRLTRAEARQTVDVLMHSHEPDWMNQITRLLTSGKGPRQIIDVIQTAAAEVILGTQDSTTFSMPQHAYEYCNTLRWFYDTFEHPHQTKLLYVAAGFVNQTAHHQTNTGQAHVNVRVPRGAARLSQPEMLRRLDESMLALQANESSGWTAAYLQAGYDRAPLLRTLATAACKFGNDPHNQELGLCLVEDYRHSTAPDRDRLLIAAAHNLAGYRKFGDPLEAYRRYAEAFRVDTRDDSRGDAPAEAAVLDD